MAPQKRQRLDDDDEEIIAVESASSSLRQEVNRKKQRLSNNQGASKSRNARDRSPDESSDESEDEELPNAEMNDDAPPAGTQYEITRDNGFRHLLHPERDDQIATQRFLRRQNLIGENRPADNAIIEEITCINFMCHDKLHVQLGPLINFIVGHNGSGKSAVLTAITLCLGGKAASTNRGSSLKSMIKSGRDQAALIIKMKNQGHDAYQPDVFGESIIIERHFSKTGSSSYKLKNANGRVISSKKGDVDDIVEYYQLQVDNPMNVLTQDAAKSFIQTSTPAQKYQFFHQGVQLEALDNDFKLMSDTCDQIEGKLNDAKDDVLALKKKAEAAAVKAEDLRKQDGIKSKVRQIRRKLAWGQVADEEEKLRQKERQVADHEQQLENAQKRIEEKAEEFEVAERNLEHAKEAVKALEDGLTPLKDEEEAAKNANEAATKKITDFRSSRRQITEKLREAKQRVQDLKDSIDKQVKLMEAANGGAHVQKLAELADAEQAAIDARATQNRNDQELSQLEHSRSAAQEGSKRLDAPLSAKRKEIEVARERLQSLNRDRGDAMAGFDRRMPRLIQMINNDRGFLEKPVGPMGLHVKLKNPLWSSILESQMASNLTGFIVTSKADQVRLSKMLKQERLEYCPVVIGNHHAIDTTGHEPDEQYETILRALEIDNEVVKRHLIISMGIEQSILVEKREDAMRVMYDGPKPRNVRQCFCLHDNKRGFGLRLGFSGRNNMGRDMTPVHPPQNRSRMKTNIESQIAYQRETVNQLETELKTIEAEKRLAETNRQKCEQAVLRNRRESNGLKIAVQRADDIVDKLKAEIDEYQLEDGVVEGLRDSLKEAELALGICEEAYGNSALERDALNQASLEKKHELEAVKEKIAEHEFLVKKAELKVRQREQARRLALTDKNQAVDNIEEIRAAKERASRKREEAAQQVADFTEEAKKVSNERVDLEPGETMASLESAFARLKQLMKVAARRQGASDQDIYDAALETDRVYKEAVSQRNELLDLLALLKQSFLKRIEMYQRFQRFISARSRINFNYLLSERAFRGKLIIDHQARKLDVQVEPDETTKSSKGRQTKTLSGGEKSFSSICLLLALWEAMGAPLRCLDEFDVFMDDVNRDVSTKLIITGARRSVGRQFILISPKALGAGAADAPDVKIIKLHDPREKQRRIDEMVQEE